MNFWRLEKVDWTTFTLFLVVATLCTVAIPWALYGLLILEPQALNEGFIALLVYIIPILYAGFIIAATDLVAACTYIVKHRDNRKAIVGCTIAALAAAIYLFAVALPIIVQLAS